MYNYFEDENNDFEFLSFSLMPFNDLMSPIPNHILPQINQDTSLFSQESNDEGHSDIIIELSKESNEIKNESQKDKKFQNNSKNNDIRNTNNSNKITFYTTVGKNSLNLPKLGRKKKREISLENEKVHNNKSSDNILRKIQVHFMSFIINYANKVLQHFNFKEKFFKINYDFKKNVKLENFNKLKNLEIGEILRQNISKKFKIEDIKHNKNLYEKVVNKNENIKYIFSDLYVNLFKNIFYQNKRIIYFNVNGEDIFIDLKNIEMFEDILEKNYQNNQDDEYIQKIKNYVYKKFIEVKN